MTEIGTNGPTSQGNERYVLARGEEGARRLQIVDMVHGPDTRAFLARLGIAGCRDIADIGCGIGTITCWIAKQCDTGGEVIGVDAGAEQIACAQRFAGSAGISKARFKTASAYESGLESERFDLVYCRFLLMHLQQPQSALLEMRRLLRPGGILAIEEGDFASPFCHPPSAAYDRCFELYRLAGEKHGEDFRIGPKVVGLLRQSGFSHPVVSLAQPVFIDGEVKRLPEWTLSESAPALIEAGLTTQDEVDQLVRELARLAEDETTQFAMARMTQVWARK